MTTPFPYTYISCPCSSQAQDTEALLTDRRASYFPPVKENEEEEEDKPLNPHDSRTNYSLYPYDHLLYCDECHQIRCPKCWTEEITNWYCPSCLFEVPSSLIKTDGNRCTRSCYNCPLCTAPLSVNALASQDKDHLTPTESQQPSGPFFLACSYCEWSSLDVGIEFSKSTKITEQLARQKRKGLSSDSSKGDETDVSSPLSKDAMFTNLTKFYQEQLQDSDPSSNNPFGDSSYNSPRSLTRIMQLYGGLSAAAMKKSQEKPQPMREALTPSEGLELLDAAIDQQDVSRLQSESSSTSTISQRLSHWWNHEAHLTADLWPVPTLLRARRSKRCSQCRHILIRLEDRKTSTSSGASTMKYKIRLLAQNHIPRLSLGQFSPGISASAVNPSPWSALTSAALKANTVSKDWNLMPGRTTQYLLTLTNPLFEPVKVTLASPTTTPGKVQSRVTILCPTFEIGADGDMWDEALSGGATTSGSRSRTAGSAARKDQNAGEERQPEAGKIWETGRNWTSVVVEVVPGSVSQAASLNVEGLNLGRKDTATNREGDESKKYGGLKDGEDILEIPILVHVEWEADVAIEEGGVASGAKPARESRELAYWSVLGAGRIVA